MTNIKIRRPKRITRQTKLGGLVLIKNQLSSYSSFKDILGSVIEKRFGLSIISLWLLMVYRALLGGTSLNQFRLDYEKDQTIGIIANYRKRITHRLLARNICRICPQKVRKIVVESSKSLFRKGLVKCKRIAIDSSFIEVDGNKYKKMGGVKKNGKYIKGYKLHLAFDVDSKIPLAYIVTSINVHDSQMLIALIKMVQSEYKNSLNTVIIDRGYYGGDFFSEISSLGLKFFIPAKKYQKLVKVINTLKFEDFKLYKKGKFYYLDDRFWIKKYGPIRCIFITYKKFEEWMPEESKKDKIWVLLTNDEKISPKNAIQTYKDRWQIEVFFKQCKNELGLGKLPGRDYRIINFHIASVLLAYIMLLSLTLEEQENDEIVTIAIKSWKNRFINLLLSISFVGLTIYYEFTEPWILKSKLLERQLNGGIFM